MNNSSETPKIFFHCVFTSFKLSSESVHLLVSPSPRLPAKCCCPLSFQGYVLNTLWKWRQVLSSSSVHLCPAGFKSWWHDVGLTWCFNHQIPVEFWQWYNWLLFSHFTQSCLRYDAGSLLFICHVVVGDLM